MMLEQPYREERECEYKKRYEHVLSLVDQLEERLIEERKRALSDKGHWGYNGYLETVEDKLVDLLAFFH